MFARRIKIVQLLLLYCIVVQSHVLRNNEWRQTELSAKSEVAEETTVEATTTGADNDTNPIVWFTKVSRIYQLVSIIYRWLSDMHYYATSSNTTEHRSFNGSIKPELESQPLLPAEVSDGRIETKDPEINADDDVLKREARSTQLNAKLEVPEENVTDVEDSTQPWRFWINRLLSKMDQWLLDTRVSNINITNHEIFHYPPEQEPPLPLRDSELEGFDRARVAQFFRMLKLVRIVEQWLNDIFSSKTIFRNKRGIFHRPMENQLPSPAKKNDDESKDQDINVYHNWDDTISLLRKTISQLFRVLKLVKRLKRMERRWNNVFPPNTIVETKRKPSMENQPLLPAEESDEELKDWEMNTDDGILMRRVRSILTQLKSNTSEATDDNCKNSSPMSWSCRIWPQFNQLLSMVDQWLVNITASNANIRINKVFQYPSEMQPALPVNPSVYGLKDKAELEKTRQLFRIAQLVMTMEGWIEDVVPSNVIQKWSNDVFPQNQPPLPAKGSNSGSKAQEKNAREVRDAKSDSGKWNYVRAGQGEISRVIDERLPKMERLVNPQLKSEMGAELDLRVTRIPAESSGHSTVSPIATSPDSYRQIVVNNSTPKKPDVMYVYPNSVRDYTAPPITAATYDESKVMYVYPKSIHSNSTVSPIVTSPDNYRQTVENYSASETDNVTYVLAESVYHTTVSPIATSSDNHQVVENYRAPGTDNVSNSTVSNDKVGNDDPSIHKTDDFHKIKLKDTEKQGEVKIDSDYSKVRPYGM